MYLLGAAELLTVEILIIISQISPEALISVHSQTLFCTATFPLGAVRCLDIGHCPYLGG